MKHTRAKKILIIGYPDSGLIRERAVFGRASGYEIHWYVPTTADYWQIEPAPEILDGVTFYTYPLPWIPKLSTLLETCYLCYILCKIRPAVVHVFMAYPYLFNVLFFLYHPLVVTVMGADIMPDQLYTGKKRVFLTNILLKKAACITSKSQFMDRALLNIGNFQQKITRITWGVDLDLFTPGVETTFLRDTLELPRHVPVFFSVRGCNTFYRHHIIIKAFATFLVQHQTEAFLLVTTHAAQETYLDSLKALAEQHRLLPYIRFLAPVPHNQMPLYYNLAMSVISVPPSDGMPQSLYESMSCGCFHLLGDLPQYHELITHKETGYFVPLGDPGALAEAMQWVFEHPETLQQAAVRNRETVRKIAEKQQQIRLINSIYDDLSVRKR